MANLFKSTAAWAAALLLAASPGIAFSQNSHRHSNNNSTSISRSTTTSQANKPKQATPARQATQQRRTDNSKKVATRPTNKNNANVGRPQQASKNVGTSRPNSGNRPGNGNIGSGSNGNNNRPGSGNRPNNNGGNRPGNGNIGNGNNGNHSWDRPGSGNRPNNNWNRPGSGNHWGQPGHSAPRPGTGGAYRPNRPTPPPPMAGRPSGYFGHWHPLPPPPPRPRNYYSVNYYSPSISTVLGLTFGSLLNVGLNALLNQGYQVASYQNDAIFLNNVGLWGMTWPQATVYYGNAGMNGALLQYRSGFNDYSAYNNVYIQLCRAYGDPVESHTVGTSRTATWWGGNNTGYITLSTSATADGWLNTDLLYGN